MKTLLAECNKYVNSDINNGILNPSYMVSMLTCLNNVDLTLREIYIKDISVLVEASNDISRIRMGKRLLHRLQSSNTPVTLTAVTLRDIDEYLENNTIEDTAIQFCLPESRIEQIKECFEDLRYGTF